MNIAISLGDPHSQTTQEPDRKPIVPEGWTVGIQYGLGFEAWSLYTDLDNRIYLRDASDYSQAKPEYRVATVTDGNMPFEAVNGLFYAIKQRCQPIHAGRNLGNSLERKLIVGDPVVMTYVEPNEDQELLGRAGRIVQVFADKYLVRYEDVWTRHLPNRMRYLAFPASSLCLFRSTPSQ